MCEILPLVTDAFAECRHEKKHVQYRVQKIMAMDHNLIILPTYYTLSLYFITMNKTQLQAKLINSTNVVLIEKNK